MCREERTMSGEVGPGGEGRGALYDNERDSDVTFVVGVGDDTWRFPGHRNVLAAANQVFGAMLCGPMAHREDVIRVSDVDARAFKHLMRYLYREPVELSSVLTARTTLDAAHKYMCPGLVAECASYLDSNLTPSTVLQVFQDLRFYCSPAPPPDAVPSAPPMYTEDTMTESCDSLLHNCLLYIDEHADEVLKQEMIEELCYEDMATIAQRDYLNLTCEMNLFNALSRWCLSECKRCKRELTSSSKRQVLGQLSYCPRYLLMTEKEFISGPKNSELLDLTECDMILSHMKGDVSVKFSYSQRQLLARFATPRTNNIRVKPVYLSERSKYVPPVVTDQAGSEDKVDSKKNKKQKKKKGKDKDVIDKKDEKSDGCSCSCFGDGLCRFFVCLFD